MTPPNIKNLFVALVIALFVLLSAEASAEITYYQNDLLGSPIVASNASGEVIWRESYRPYGERLQNSTASADNKVWFTSRHQDADTGLSYMGVRYYDPVLGRFLSADPVRFQQGNAHSFNRYAYANNNPYAFVDPDGENPVSFMAKIKQALSLLKISGEGENIQKKKSDDMSKLVACVDNPRACNSNNLNYEQDREFWRGAGEMVKEGADVKNDLTKKTVKLKQEVDKPEIKDPRESPPYDDPKLKAKDSNARNPVFPNDKSKYYDPGGTPSR